MISTTGCRNWRMAARCTELLSQRSSAAVIGQPMVAVGVTRTRPPSAAETLSGAKMPQALRPRIDEACVT
ncbi:hypothetical protein AUC70_02375 [Methyloceanibacter stevinii]|uniref:Uncharacterized protein n=1 Tax=Methyloceanibacter stevinii TaxID=1774970 RepID=A0A1E3VQD9_9HYPH|nr:hypothetical protein AUC70_02375 [Methyloceanibacter stevinii]